MSGQRFTNARVHEWLTPDLDEVATSMRSTRVQLNSAAIWWFCRRLPAEQRAEILGEFVKFQALSASGIVPRSDENLEPLTAEAGNGHSGNSNGHSNGSTHRSRGRRRKSDNGR